MASPDKIGNRRGHDKWFSDAELERWAETHRPVRAIVWPAQGLGVVESEHHEAQEVHPNRAAPAAQRGAVDLGVLVAAVQEDLGVRVPGEPRVVEDGALDGGQAHRKKPEHKAAGQREAQLGVHHGQTRADELVELRAAALGGAAEAFVVDQGPGGIATEQVRAPEELAEQICVPPEAAEEHAPQGERERPREEVAAPVDQDRREFPGAEARGGLDPPAGARERSHPPEQRVVVDQDRKSTRLNSSHLVISYAVFCLKKKKKNTPLSLNNKRTQGVRGAIATPSCVPVHSTR